MTSQWASWCIKSPANRLFNNKIKIKAPHHWPFVRGFNHAKGIFMSRCHYRVSCRSMCNICDDPRVRLVSRNVSRNVWRHYFLWIVFRMNHRWWNGLQYTILYLCIISLIINYWSVLNTSKLTYSPVKGGHVKTIGLTKSDRTPK